ATHQHAGQASVAIGDGEGIVRSVVPRGAGGARAAPIPGLAGRITLAHEQDVLGLRPAGHEYRHRFRLAEAGEVVKVAVLAVRILDVAVPVPYWGCGQ